MFYVAESGEYDVFVKPVGKGPKQHIHTYIAEASSKRSMPANSTEHGYFTSILIGINPTSH